MLKSTYILMMECLVKNGKPRKGATDLLDVLYRERIPFVVLSEQSGKKRENMTAEMQKIGFHTFRNANLYTSSMAAVDFLSVRFSEKNRVAAIGGAGLQEAVKAAEYIQTSSHPDFIFMGMNRNLAYDDYCAIYTMINDGGILVSVDGRKTMSVDGEKALGNDAFVHMLTYASSTSAIEFGRGTPLYLDMVLRYLGTEGKNVVMVGCSFIKDIIPALKKGMTTVYVTDGRSIENEGMNEKVHPDYIVEDLSGLIR